MVVKIEEHRERKRAPGPNMPLIIGEEEAEEYTIISLDEREKQQYLREENFWQDSRGLSVLTYRKEQQVCMPIFRGHLDVLTRRHVFNVPTRLEKAPHSEDTLFSVRAGSLDGSTSQELLLSQNDMLSRQPEYPARFFVAPLPHARHMSNFAHAIKWLGYYKTVPVETVYSASGLLRVQEQLIFLNPAGAALTASGPDAEKRVQYSASLAETLSLVPYGWERTSTQQEAPGDIQTLLQLLDIAPGAPGYGALLVGIAGFSPFSQMCSTGGVHLVVHGPSGSQKSSTARLAQSGYAATWGRAETQAVNLRAGASTIYSIEQKAHHLAGLFVLLDDGLKGNKVPEKDIGAFYKMLEAYGSHAAARMGRDAGVWNSGKGGAAASFYPRCSSVFTVETLPQSSQHTSELARFAVITLDGQDAVHMPLLSALQQESAARALNRAIATYIQWLLPRMAGYLDTLEAREAFYQVPGVHPRTVPTYAKLEAGLAALLDYAASVGALSTEDAGALLTREREALQRACIAQQALIGRGAAHAKSNDAVKLLYFYLAKALRDGKLYTSDAAMIDTPLTTGGTEKRHQPPTCLGVMGRSKEDMGWRFRKDMAQGNGEYFPASGAQHAGPIRKRGQAPAELKMLQRTWQDEIYPHLERMARADDAVLPDYSDMCERLKRAQSPLLAGPTNSTELHGRGSEKGRCFVLSLLPLEEHTPDQGPGAGLDTLCSWCGEYKEDGEMFFTPIGEYVCTDCYTPGTPGPDRPGARHQEQNVTRGSDESAPISGTDQERGADQPAEAATSGSGSGQEHGPTVPASRRQRIAAYVDVSSGRGMLDDGRTLTGTPGADLARIVRALPADVTQLFLTGERPGESGTLADMLTWADAGEIALAPEWVQDTRPGKGHFIPSHDSDTLDKEPVYRFQHQETGRKLDIRRMSAWLGEEEYTPEEARAMRQALLALLREAFGPKAYLMATPAQTGKELWKSTVTWTEYQPLPDDVQQLIRSTSGQGRREICPSDAATLPALYYLDGVFMYSALTNGLGSGPVQRDTLNEYAGYRPGRYRIRFTVPEGWAHVGLFMVPTDDTTRNDGEKWFYPSRPGESYETWADGAELHAAYQAQERTGADWRIEIQERLLLTAPTGHGPLYAWAQKLIGLRESLPGRIASGQLDARTADLVKSALRNLLLHTIGGFHRGAHAVTRRTLDKSQVPASNPTVRQRGRFWTWEEQERLGKGEAFFQHPEWSAAIYGRCRSRLLLHRQKIGQEDIWSGALTLPRESIVGFWTDAIMTSTLPTWADGTRPGQFKVKGRIEQKVKTPKNEAQVSRLRERMKTPAEGK